MEPESGFEESPSNIDNNNIKKKKTSNIINTSENKSKKKEPEIDLTNIEANEESLKPYTLSKQFLKLDLDKIRELIVILEEYWQSLVKKEDIDLAKTAKQRLILLKKIEKEKMMIEAKIIYSNQLELIQDKMKEDLDAYIINSDVELENLMQRFKEQEIEMEKINQEELEEYRQNFEQNYSQLKPKPSKECLNWMLIKKYALKQFKFNKAQEATKEIERLNNIDNIKFNENKEKKFNIELSKIKHRQELESRVYQMKKNSIITQFNENKQNQIDKIKRKYISKISELKNYQSFEMANFDKITKGVIKPCSRIQNIVSSATGIKDEDEDENEQNNKENEDKEIDINKEENETNKEIKESDKKDKEENDKENIEENVEKKDVGEEYMVKNE